MHTRIISEVQLPIWAVDLDVLEEHYTTLDGHAFNIVNDGGNVRIFDGQIGKEIPMDQLGGYI